MACDGQLMRVVAHPVRAEVQGSRRVSAELRQTGERCEGVARNNSTAEVRCAAASCSGEVGCTGRN
jgi:hypothetical protein